MPDGIEYRIDFDERSIVTRFEQLPAVIAKNLQRVIGSLGRIMYAQVLAAEPDRTGALRAQTRLFLNVTDDRIAAVVRVLGDVNGSHNIKAAALEYGAHRRFTVQEHQMRGGAQIKAYQRRANITGLHFLQSGREGIAAQYRAEIEAAIQKSLNGEAV